MATVPMPPEPPARVPPRVPWPPFWASRSTCLSGIPGRPAAQQPFHHGRLPHGLRSGDLQNRAFARLGLQPVPERARRTPQVGGRFTNTGSAELDEGVLADTNYETPISISNSFGVPSQSPDVWQPDMRAAIEAAVPVKCWSRASKARVWRA